MVFVFWTDFDGFGVRHLSGGQSPDCPEPRQKRRTKIGSLAGLDTHPLMGRRAGEREKGQSHTAQSDLGTVDRIGRQCA